MYRQWPQYFTYVLYVSSFVFYLSKRERETRRQMEYQLEERRRLECESEIQYRQLCGSPELTPPFFIIGEKEKEEEERVSYIQFL